MAKKTTAKVSPKKAIPKKGLDLAKKTSPKKAPIGAATAARKSGAPPKTAHARGAKSEAPPKITPARGAKKSTRGKTIVTPAKARHQKMKPQPTPAVPVEPKFPASTPATGGTIVTDMDPCTCGCAPEEHGRDPEFPGSTGCTVCDCVAYEAEPGVSEDAAGPQEEDPDKEDPEADNEDHEAPRADPGFLDDVDSADNADDADNESNENAKH